MERYTNEELNVKIHSFLNKKFEKYPELAKESNKAPVFSKPSFAARIHSMTSVARLSSN